MARTILRDIRSVVVGTTSTLLLPERNGRILTVIGAPPPPVAPAAAALSTARTVSLATITNLLVYTPPTGATGIITGWSWNSTSTTAVLALRIVRGGLPFIIDQGGPNVWHNVSVPVAAPDTASIIPTTVGLGGETADITIGATSYNTVPRISLGIGGAAVLDAGLTIYAGQLPLVLPGPALDTEIYGIADAAGRIVNVIDLWYA